MRSATTPPRSTLPSEKRGVASRPGSPPIEREALDRARKLINVAADTGATPAERQAAYKKVRAELDGIIDVPRVAAAHLEQQIAGALERGSD